MDNVITKDGGAREQNIMLLSNASSVLLSFKLMPRYSQTNYIANLFHQTLFRLLYLLLDLSKLQRKGKCSTANMQCLQKTY